MPHIGLPRTKPWSPTARRTGLIPHDIPTGKKTIRISMSKIHNRPLRSKNQPKSQRIFSRQADYPPSTNHFPQDAPPTATRRKQSCPLPLTSREAQTQTGRPYPPTLIPARDLRGHDRSLQFTRRSTKSPAANLIVPVEATCGVP